MAKNPISILEELSKFFQIDDLSEEEQEELYSEGIVDFPDEQYMLLIPAGYSKPDNSGNNRQEHYKKIADMSKGRVLRNVFNKLTTDIYLEHDKNNKFDQYAIKIYMNHAFKNMELGFIPKRINKKILKNIDAILNIELYGVFKKSNTNLYYVMIRINYDENLINKNFLMQQRFASLLEEG